MAVPSKNTYYALRANNRQFVSRILLNTDNIQAVKNGVDVHCVYLVMPNGGSTVVIQADNQGLWSVQSDGSVDADATALPTDSSTQFTWEDQDTNSSLGPTSVAFRAASSNLYVKCDDSGDLVLVTDSTANVTNTPQAVFELIKLIGYLSVPEI